MSDRPGSGAAAVAYRLVTLALVVSVALLPVYLAFEVWGDGNRVSAEAQLSPESVSLPAGMSFRGWPDVSIRIGDPTTEQSVLLVLEELGTWLIAIACLWLLRGVVRSARDGDPFGAANVTRLRRLGTLLVTGSFALSFFEYGIRTALFNRLPPQTVEIGARGWELPGEGLLAGLGVFVLAGVFAHGLRLREDVEATV